MIRNVFYWKGVTQKHCESLARSTAGGRFWTYQPSKSRCWVKKIALLNWLLFSYFDICISLHYKYYIYIFTFTNITNMKETQQGNLPGAGWRRRTRGKQLSLVLCRETGLVESRCLVKVLIWIWCESVLIKYWWTGSLGPILHAGALQGSWHRPSCPFRLLRLIKPKNLYHKEMNNAGLKLQPTYLEKVAGKKSGLLPNRVGGGRGGVVKSKPVFWKSIFFS